MTRKYERSFPPVSFEEKVAARYTRGPRHQCWIWEGGLSRGRPSLNARFVGRYIYEQEFGPIPPGVLLVRTDHDETCKPLQRHCRHMLCVNPYHVVQDARSGKFGTYERENARPVSEGHEQARQRARTKNVRKRNQEGQSLDQPSGGTE